MMVFVNYVDKHAEEMRESAQLRHARAVALLFDGRAKHLLEALLAAQSRSGVSA